MQAIVNHIHLETQSKYGGSSCEITFVTDSGEKWKTWAWSKLKTWNTWQKIYINGKGTLVDNLFPSKKHQEYFDASIEPIIIAINQRVPAVVKRKQNINQLTLFV
jgi:hypothetical protein